MKTAAHSVIEPLEARLAPAGLIAVSVSGAGDLVLATVPGQDGDEAVTIDRLNDGSYLLTPGAGVTLRIGGSDFTTAQVLFGVTGGLAANLGAGSDSIALSGCFFSRPSIVNLAAGNNTFSMTDSSIAGSLAVVAGDGNDSVSFLGNDCAVGGPATFKLGAGNDAVTSTANRLGFGAGLLIDGGAGNDAVALALSDGDDVRLLGNFKYLGGSGDDVLTLGTTNATFSASGAVMMTDAGGSETVTLAGTRFDAAALLLPLGAGNNTVTSSVGQFTLARNLQFAAGAGTDNVTIAGNSVRIGTSVDINLGTGSGSASLDPSALISIGGTAKLTASAAAGVARNLELDAVDIIVGGKVTLMGGAGDGSLTVFGFESAYLGAGASILSGAGISQLNIVTNGSLISNGSITLSHGGGDGFLQVFSSSAAINGSVTMKGGDTAEVLMAGLITGPINVATSPNPVNNPVIGLKTNGSDGLTCAASVSVKLPSLAGGTGSITVENVHFQSTAVFLGGAGGDTINLEQINAAKAITVNLGAGADSFRLERSGITGGSTYLGPLLLIGGSGADTFEIGGNTAGINNIDFRGAVTADGGTEADTLTVGTQVTFAPGLPLTQKNIP